jgi:hypothetical protein
MWLLTWLAPFSPWILSHFLWVLSVCGRLQEGLHAQALWLFWILPGSHTWAQQLLRGIKKEGGTARTRDRSATLHPEQDMSCLVKMGKQLLKTSPGTPLWTIHQLLFQGRLPLYIIDTQ